MVFLGNISVNTLNKTENVNNNNNKHKLITLEEQLLTPSAVTNLSHHCDIWEVRNKYINKNVLNNILSKQGECSCEVNSGSGAHSKEGSNL